MKVLIACPCLDTVATDFAFSLAALVGLHAYDKKLRREAEIAIIHQRGSNYALARNQLVKDALALGASHILFIDSDMTFPPTALNTLLAHHVPIVGANYVRRETGEVLGAALRDNPPRREGLTPMFHLPLGFTLLSTKVFAALGEPYFSYAQSGAVSEDTAFCASLRERGFTIWCDPKLSTAVGHIGQAIYRMPA